ncbi:T9SS type A sorting domain-containing protein (plasmid) [Hymenobacter tibetensis]|uniref:T9SS type A sorting domain-containing protein n=1 Tax=Hymenobacter tibetensis TaxID=497967 RepID=A0ABY4D4A6_9BACT|nr:cellulose binding domain-containing protein [Hymenobacter tibetensis]UOG77350.1 T9SS type A sorting domain-containing protein [Hymenobacter tibetensis]
MSVFYSCKARYWAILLLLGGLLPVAGHAQLSLTSGAPTTVDFNSLGTSATASLPTGFVLANGSTVTYGNTANPTATMLTGGISGAGTFTGSSTGGPYNFADGVAASAPDRALGFLSSGSYTSPRHILLAVQNNTTATITQLAVTYDIEKYRSGSRAFEWQFHTSADGSSWTQLTGLTEVFVADANNTTIPTSITPISKRATLSGLNLAPGATTYLRWSYVGILNPSSSSTSTNAQALGLDNLTLTPTLSTAPPTAAISTGNVSGSFCVGASAAGSSFSVPFTSTGALTGAFTVQLSNASGTFSTDLTQNIIGQGSVSPLTAAVPAGTPSGTGYRVRVVHPASATIGTPSTTNLTITAAPANNTVTVSATGPQTVATSGTGGTLTATASAPSTYAWYYGTTNGGPYSAAISSATSASYVLKGTDFGGAGTYYVVARATSTCGDVVGTSTPITVTVTAPTPSLTFSALTQPDFGSLFLGSPSSSQRITVTGANLTAPVTVTPPTGFEIRTGTGAFACCAITLTPQNGTLATTIDVRFLPTLAQAYSSTLPVSSPDVPTVPPVAVAGTGVAPTYPATAGTAPVADITSFTATASGTVTADGGAPVTERGFVFAPYTAPTLADSILTVGNGTGSFTGTLTGLRPNQQYYVRAYAVNNEGTAYGEEIAFTTVAVPLAAEPTVQATVRARDVTSNSLTLSALGGNGAKRLIVARLGSSVAAVPVDATSYTANAAFGSGNQLGTGNYLVYQGTDTTVTVTNLRPDATYTFAVFEYNDNNTPYAENYLTTTPGILTQKLQPAPAALLLEENFDYPATTLLTANGWRAHSGAGNSAVKVAANSLNQIGYSASGIGNSAALVGNGEDVNRPFAAVEPGTPVYLSFLVNVANASTVAAGDYFLHLGSAPFATDNYRGRVFVRKTTSGQIQFGISGSGAAVYAPTEYALNTTHLLVVKYTFDDNSSVSSLFVNPTTDTEPAAATTSSSEGATSTAPNIGAVALRQGTNFPNLTVDGIRVGNTFRVVKTGLICLPPAPQFTAAPVCAGETTTFTDASSGVAANATYAWDVNGDGVTDYSTKGSITHKYATDSTYTVTLTITQGGCSQQYSQAVVVRALPTAVISGTPTICAGTTTNLPIQLTGVAPWTLTYSAGSTAPPTTVTVTASDVTQGIYQLDVTPTATSTYTITSVQDANCTGSTPSGSATVTVNTAPVLTVPTVAPVDATAGLRGASVSFAATATGSTPAPAVTYTILLNGTTKSITSPYVFPLGTTVVTATATNDCGTVSQTFPVTVQSPTLVRVLHQNADGSVGNNVIKPNLQLINNSPAAIPYAELSVRYWLTAEDYAPITAAIDYALVGTSAVRATYVALREPAKGAFGYVEYTFTAAGNLPVGGNSGVIQSRIFKQTQTNFNESDDHSYALNSTYQFNDRITVYRGGVLIGGIEPDLAPVEPAVQVWTENKERRTTANTISTYLQVRNVGTQPLSYQDLTVRYWFSPEGTQQLNSFIDYAQLGAGNVSVTFGQAGTEKYAELRFAASLGALAPLSTTGNVQYRIAKTDWSNFNQANDFSYRPFGALSENNHVTVYLQGQRIYGEEPAGATVASRGTQVVMSSAATPQKGAHVQTKLRSYPNPFTGSTTLEFALAQSGKYQLEIYDLQGRLVQRVQASEAPTRQLVRVPWEATAVTRGLYMARLITGTGTQTLKLQVE